MDRYHKKGPIARSNTDNSDRAVDRRSSLVRQLISNCRRLHVLALNYNDPERRVRVEYQHHAESRRSGYAEKVKDPVYS